MGTFPGQVQDCFFLRLPLFLRPAAAGNSKHRRPVEMTEISGFMGNGLSTTASRELDTWYFSDVLYNTFAAHPPGRILTRTAVRNWPY